MDKPKVTATEGNQLIVLSHLPGQHVPDKVMMASPRNIGMVSGGQLS
jgi:hypothetical protein